MKTYTVIGLHAEADWKGGIRGATFVHAVKAATPTLAAREAKRQMTTSYACDPGNPDDIEIIAVFEGRHTDHYEPTLDTEDYERSVGQVAGQMKAVQITGLDIHSRSQESGGGHDPARGGSVAGVIGLKVKQQSALACQSLDHLRRGTPDNHANPLLDTQALQQLSDIRAGVHAGTRLVSDQQNDQHPH